MKKLMYIFLALPILTGCKEKKSTGAMGGMPTPEISVTKPIVEDITLTKDYPGYLTTEKTVNLVARVNGTLQSTSYVAGGRVKQGQLLFVIEPTLYKDQVEQAEAELKTAQAQLEYARNNYRLSMALEQMPRIKTPCAGFLPSKVARWTTLSSPISAGWNRRSVWQRCRLWRKNCWRHFGQGPLRQC